MSLIKKLVDKINEKHIATVNFYSFDPMGHSKFYLSALEWVLNEIEKLNQESVVDDGWISIDDDSLKQYANKEILIYACDTVRKAIYSVDNSPYIDDDSRDYQYSHWFSDEFGDFMWEFDEVKFWRPLPKPPKEQKNEL